MERMPGVYGDTPEVRLVPGERTVTVDARAVAASPNPCAILPHEVVPFGPSGGVVVLDCVFDADCLIPFAPVEAAGSLAILALMSGRIVVRLDDADAFLLAPGECLVARVGADPGTGFYEGGIHLRAFCLQLMPADVAALLARDWGRGRADVRRLLGRTPADPIVVDAEAVRAVAQAALSCRLDGPARAEFLVGLAPALVAALAAGAAAAGAQRCGGGPHALLDLARDARDRLLAELDQPPTLEELARVAGVAPRALNDALRAVFGGGANELVREARLMQARDRLLGGERDLPAIARGAGFNHVTNFTTAFRRRFGAPPAAFVRRSAPP